METVHASADALPFGDATFDAAVSIWTHTDVDDFAAVLAEARKGATCRSAVRLHRRAPVLRRASLPLLRRSRACPSSTRATAVPVATTTGLRSCPRVFGRGSALRTSRSASSSRPSWTQASRSSASRSDGVGRVPVRRRAALPPVSVAALSDELLAGEEIAYVGTEPAREATTAPLPPELDERVVGGARAPGHHEPLRAPGRGVGGSRARRARGRHHRHGERQDARLQPAGARRDRPRPEGARALPLSDEGSRAGSGAQPHRPRRARRAAGDLRRRHADRAATPGADVGQRHPLQPGHAPPRRPASSRPLGRRAREPRVRHRRRGSRVPRRVRLACGERAATPAAAGGRLRRGAAVPARLRDDREPGRARADADGSRGDGRLRRLGAAGRADDRALEPAGDRRGAQPPRQRARRGCPPARRARRARPADAVLREEPQGRRAHPSLRPRPARPRVQGPALAVPRRLHARAATRHRAAARGRRAARRLRDGCARARHRHRPARLRDLGGLSGHRRQPAAAVGPCGPAGSRASRCSSPRTTRSTSTSCASRTRCSAGASRPRSSITRTRACSTATCSRPPTRRRSTTTIARRSGTRRSSAPPSCPSCAARPRASRGPGRDYPAARISLRSAGVDSVLVVEAESGSVLGIVERERAYSTVHAGAVYLHLGEPYLVSELDLAAGAALVEPFSGTGTRRRRRTRRRRSRRRVLVGEHGGVELSFGRVSVTEHVVAYQRKSTRDGAVLETVALDLPPATFETEAVWFVPSRVGAGRPGARCRSCCPRSTRPSMR